MKFLTNPETIRQSFQDDFKWCREFYCATAWASCIKGVTDLFNKYPQKLKKVVVGLHFFQTHPDFIKEHLNSQTVKFIQQSDGTFHPKFFLFVKGPEWRLILGSANLTNAAFNCNTEVCCSCDNTDKDAKKGIDDVYNFINDSFENAESFTEERYEKYKSVWNIHQQKIKRLAGTYGDSDEPTNRIAIYDNSVLQWDWNTYYKKLREKKDFDECLKVLHIAEELFATTDSFEEMKDNERRYIAGINGALYTRKEVDYGCFGWMNPAIEFRENIVPNRYPELSKALGSIPLKGSVSYNNYKSFVDVVMSIPGMGVATSTRLLAMKRPDTFLCLDSENVEGLCEKFGIKPISLNRSEKNFQRYWDEVILQIQDCDWWNSALPEKASDEERKTWRYRTAFIDRFYYGIA